MGLLSGQRMWTHTAYKEISLICHSLQRCNALEIGHLRWERRVSGYHQWLGDKPLGDRNTGMCQTHCWHGREMQGRGKHTKGDKVGELRTQLKWLWAGKVENIQLYNFSDVFPSLLYRKLRIGSWSRSYATLTPIWPAAMPCQAIQWAACLPPLPLAAWC